MSHANKMLTPKKCNYLDMQSINLVCIHTLETADTLQIHKTLYQRPVTRGKLWLWKYCCSWNIKVRDGSKTHN